MRDRGERILRTECYSHNGKRTVALHTPVRSTRHRSEAEEHHHQNRYEDERDDDLSKRRSHTHILQLFRLESKRIADNRHARPCHGESREYGREEPAEDGKEYAACERDAHDVVDERPEEVLLDAAHGYF